MVEAFGRCLVVVGEAGGEERYWVGVGKRVDHLENGGGRELEFH